MKTSAQVQHSRMVFSFSKTTLCIIASLLTFITFAWFRSSNTEVFLGKDVLRICSKFTGEHQLQSVISIKLQSNFIKITLRHGCSPVNLLCILEYLFLRKPLDGCACWLVITKTVSDYCFYWFFYFSVAFFYWLMLLRIPLHVSLWCFSSVPQISRLFTTPATLNSFQSPVLRNGHRIKEKKKEKKDCHSLKFAHRWKSGRCLRKIWKSCKVFSNFLWSQHVLRATLSRLYESSLSQDSS